MQNTFEKDQKSSSWFDSLLCYCIYYMKKCPIHAIWAQGKHQIHYESLEEVSEKNLWQTIYNNYYAQKCSKLLQWKMHIKRNYTLEFAICTEKMELLKLYSKEKTIFFCLIKLLFIKVRCLINVNVSLEAILEGQGWW